MKNRHFTGIFIVYKNGICMGRILANSYSLAMNIAVRQYGRDGLYLNELEA